MIEVLMAFVLPIVLMLVITRVTFSTIGALAVTLMILIFAGDAEERSLLVLAIGLVSLVIGWFGARRLLKKKPGM